MSTIFKGIGIFIAVVILIYFLATITGLVDLQYSKFFGVQKANIQREIMTENKSFVDGGAKDIAKFKYEYEQETDTAAKKAIQQTIIDRFANYDANNLTSPSLRGFLKSMRGY